MMNSEYAPSAPVLGIPWGLESLKGPKGDPEPEGEGWRKSEGSGFVLFLPPPSSPLPFSIVLSVSPHSGYGEDFLP